MAATPSPVLALHPRSPVDHASMHLPGRTWQGQGGCAAAHRDRWRLTASASSRRSRDAAIRRYGSSSVRKVPDPYRTP